MGGVDGPFSYAYFTIMVLYMAILPKSYRIPFVVVLCLICLVLTFDYQDQMVMTIIPWSSSLNNPLGVDYIFNSILIAIGIVLLKKHFDSERNQIKEHNTQLDNINDELNAKREKLISQQDEIKRIKENLEELIQEHTVELKKRHSQLADYAYDNAHLVRAPLSNILGIVELMKEELSSNSPQFENLDQINKNASELDRIVRKINLILK